jgi:hypothetical protein
VCHSDYPQVCSVFLRSVKVEIAKKNPINIVIDVTVPEPVNEFSSGWFSAGAIDVA